MGPSVYVGDLSVLILCVCVCKFQNRNLHPVVCAPVHSTRVVRRWQQGRSSPSSVPTTAQSFPSPGTLGESAFPSLTTAALPRIYYLAAQFNPSSSGGEGGPPLQASLARLPLEEGGQAGVLSCRKALLMCKVLDSPSKRRSIAGQLA